MRSSSNQNIPTARITSRKDRTQSSPLGWKSQMSYVESKADVRNQLAEPRAHRVLALLSAKGRWRRRAMYTKISPFICLMLLLSNFTLETFWKQPKKCVSFSPQLNNFLLLSTIKCFTLIHCLIYNGLCPSYTEMLLSCIKYNCSCVHTLSLCKPWPLHFRNVTLGGVYRRLNISLSVLLFPWKIFFLQHMGIKYTEQY